MRAREAAAVGLSAVSGAAGLLAGEPERAAVSLTLKNDRAGRHPAKATPGSDNEGG